MNRMWEIREQESPKYGYRKDKSEEAYECGYEDGFKAAMREASYGERRSRY